jgi:2-oxo-4-hydroxy-4-carboxy-5-ureidoimidazoline decarboxylase
VSASDKLNISEEDARAALTRCCGATKWVDAMLASRPFADDAAVFTRADEAWATMERADILEAFTHHPRIGSSIEALREKFGTKGDLEWSGDEQAGVQEAQEATLVALRDGNVAFEERFGHIFIVCATGKSAAEMLALLNARLPGEHTAELAIAAGEQAKITRIRLQKLAEEE